MPEIVDLDELVPEDITFKYRQKEYRIPGDLRTDQTLNLFALLQRLAKAEATGTAKELARIIGQAEAALLPIFQVHQPDMVELPFGAAGLGHVLRRVLVLIGLLQVGPGGGAADPPKPAPVKPNRKTRRASASTSKTTKRGSAKRTSSKRSAGSSK